MFLLCELIPNKNMCALKFLKVIVTLPLNLANICLCFFPRQRRDRRTQHLSSATRPGCGRGWSVTSRDLHRGPELQQGAICGLHCVGGAVRHHH